MSIYGKIIFAFLIFCFCVPVFPQGADDDDEESNPSGTVQSVVNEAWEVYKQYRRVVDRVSAFWEEEIKSGKYSQNRNDPAYRKISGIFSRLQSARKPEGNYNWRIYIKNDSEVNAHAATNGIVIVNSAMIDYCLNDDELAVVIGHEMGHITQEHLKNRLASKTVANAVVKKLAAYIAKKKNRKEDIETMSDKEISDKEMFEAMFGLAGELGLLTYSRRQEKQADETGALLAQSAGYDANSGCELFERAAKNKGANLLFFLSTHPESKDRAVFLKGWSGLYGNGGKHESILKNGSGVIPELSVTDLVNEFADYNITAKAIYTGRQITVTGKIKDVDTKLLGKKGFRVELSIPGKKLGDFDCYFPPDAGIAPAALKKGAAVKISGRCKNGDTLEDCVMWE